EDGAPGDKGAAGRGDDAEAVAADEGKRGHGGPVAEKDADKQDVDRQPGGAGHEGRDEDGGESLAPVGDGAGGHDAGQGAGVGGEEGDEGVAGEAQGPQQAVHDERGTREVAGVLEKGDEEEEQADLGQEDDNSADAGDNAVGGEVGDDALGEHRDR